MNDEDKNKKTVDDAFEDLMNSLREDTTEENRELIRKAFHLANEAHGGGMRKSGEPYILHPIAVAKIASVEIGLGTKSVVTALLHDVVEDTTCTVEDIAEQFGDKIAELVKGLTKIKREMGDDTDTTRQAENFRKIIQTLPRDVRVILIKIADRLHNMRTLSSLPEYKQVKIAGETLFIYAPLAHRMGLHAIKNELEDLSLKYENPEEYTLLQGRLQNYRSNNIDLIQRFITPIRERLREHGYNPEIIARTKSVSSVWFKMQLQNITFEQIPDLLAVRIIFDPKDAQTEKWECWQIYSLITDLYSPRQGSILNWLSAPKSNGYEALHAAVMAPGGGWVEVQIRTRRMNDIDEKGLAARWKYKTADSDPISELEKWLVDIREMLERADSTGPLELLDNIKLSLFTKEIHVYTPKGDKKILPKGACVLDSAYAIHSELGDRCIGAKVNNNLVPVSHPLQDGDRVEILTGEKQVPNAEWVKFIVTAKARQHIMAALREERKEQTRQGLQIYEDLLQKNNLVPTQGQLDRTLHRLGLTDKDALYLALYKQQISQEQLRKALIGNRLMRYFGLQSAGPREAVAKPTTDENREQKNAPAGQDVKNDPTVVIATDCNPIPGDTVVAFDINGETVVHKRTCKEAIRLMASRGHRIITNVPWAKSNVESFLAAVHLRGIDNIGIASEVTRVISKESNVNMRSIRFGTRDGLFDGTILLDIHNTTDLNNLMAKIATLSGVKKVTRIENIETTENPSRKQ